MVTAFFFAIGCAVVVAAWCMNPSIGDERSERKPLTRFLGWMRKQHSNWGGQ